jgi:N-methylhydantoinase A
LWEGFHEAHKSRFGFDNRGEVIEIVTFSASVWARVETPSLPELAGGGAAGKPRSHREVGFSNGQFDTPIYWRDDLVANQVIAGPAVVEEAASVTLVLPGQTLSVDHYGHLVIAN